MASLLLNFRQNEIVYKLICSSLEEAYFIAAPLCYYRPPSYMDVIQRFSTSQGIMLNEIAFSLYKSNYEIYLRYSRHTDELLRIIPIDKKEFIELCKKDMQNKKSYTEFELQLRNFDM
jgi:hypothetical protein